MLRHQLPVWSPVTPGAVVRGLVARNDHEAPTRLAAQLQSEYGTRLAVPVASGTVALILALAAARPPGGRLRVAIPAWGCYDLATAADGADAVVRLYDLNSATLAPEPESLASVLRAGVDAVVVAHYFGVPVDPGPLARSGIGPLLVDDGAQGAGARLGGRRLGTLGDLGVLSFGRGKGRTGGGGGAVLAASERGAAALERMVASLEDPPSRPVRAAALLAALWLLGRPSVYGIPASLPWLRLGETIYHPAPRLERISPFASAVLLAGAKRCEEEEETRRETGRWWCQALTGLRSVATITVRADAEPGWLRYPVLVAAPLRAEFAGRRLRSLGVMPGYPLTLDELPGFRSRIVDLPSAGLAGARELARGLFTLPTHSLLSSRDRERLLRIIRSFG